MSPQSERSSALEAIDRILDRGGDADDVLRQIVTVLHRLYAHAGIDFVEPDGLHTGPELGARGEDAERIPILYQGNRVGDLVVETPGPEARMFLDRVATLVSAYVLLGWDTGGETWEP